MNDAPHSKTVRASRAVRATRRFLPLVGCVLVSLGFVPAEADAQQGGSYTQLYAFSGADGSGPTGTLIQGADGNFYGTTQGSFSQTVSTADAATNGTVFSMTPSGVVTTLHIFDGSKEGTHPAAALVQMPDGNLYGTTSGGFGGSGVTVFRLATNGSGFTTLIGGRPQTGTNNAWLTRGSDGLLYVTLRQDGTVNYGSVFSLTTDGAATALYSFKGQPDGEFPSGPLIQAADGKFYGCTGGGGGGRGTVYSITPDGTYTQVYALAASGYEGTGPNSLVQAGDGNFYATCQQGGDPSYPSAGTAFRLTPAGVFTKLIDLGASSYVVDSVSSFVVGPDGGLYGTGKLGGETGTGGGGVFRLSLDGVYSPVYAFDADDAADGEYPFGGVCLGSDGNFYGTTGGRIIETDTRRGGDQYGTIFRISLSGHAPFFGGEVPLANGVYYLAFPGGAPFGYYSYLDDPHYIYHFDLGFEYVFDANDGQGGVYLYDFASNGFFYTSPAFPFPYLYDFALDSVVYYYPDPNNPGRYNTDGVRFIYVFNSGSITTF